MELITYFSLSEKGVLQERIKRERVKEREKTDIKKRDKQKKKKDEEPTMTMIVNFNSSYKTTLLIIIVF